MSLPTPYQQFIQQSRYARWREEDSRRETWEESVERYMSFMRKHLWNKHKYTITTSEYKSLGDSIVGLEVLPSMRSLMTAGPALERENVAGYNCFGPEVRFITPEGLKRFDETVGTTQMVLNGKGKWSPAEIKNFGQQELVDVVFRPGHQSRTQIRHTVAATRNHRWITTNRGEVTDLCVGDTVSFVGPEIPDLIEEAFIMGFGFGDGTLDARGRARIRLCGEKDNNVLGVFERYGNASFMSPPSANGDTVVVFHKGHFVDWKELPAEDSAPEYLRSWLIGYLSADGGLTGNRPVLNSQNPKAIDFVEKIAPLCGFAVVGKNYDPVLETNYGKRSSPMCRLKLYTDVVFKVTSINETDRIEDVYCAVVPDGSDFVLENGIHTGNCAFLPVEDLRAFDETLYILMNGTGVGFSVQNEYVSKLPPVNTEFKTTLKTIDVDDSREGWASSTKELIQDLFNGEIPSWTTHRLRKKGDKLKTFGGRSSGPEPLIELFEFLVKTITAAAGRQLTSLECHDIMCKIAEIVVVGGVRRSALISFSDPGDKLMQGAKSGNWRETHPHRRLANNSICYTSTPSLEDFTSQWQALIDSYSGERGVFNLSGMQKFIDGNGRRDASKVKGSNPCQSYETLLLTRTGLRRIGDLAENETKFEVLNGDGKWAASYAWETGVKPVYKVKLVNGLSIKLTADHIVEVVGRRSNKHPYNIPSECKVKDLRPGMKIRPLINPYGGWEGGQEVPRALLYGLLFGDGCRQTNGGLSAYINTNEKEVIDFILKEGAVELALKATTRNFRVPSILEELNNAGIVLEPLPERRLPEEIFSWSADSVRQFLKGLYSANGSSMSKYSRITLKSTCLDMVQDVQRILSALGYSAYITTNAPSEIEWENGTYTGKESYDLNIGSAEQYDRFQREIGFLHEHKAVPSILTRDFVEPRVTSIKSVEYVDTIPVYDFNESITHYGWANGIKVHNCAEIALRKYQFCNLSTTVVREYDTLDTMLPKVEKATILGTYQSTLTDFNYIRDEWRKNTEEERLLGVSMTGIASNKLFSGLEGLETLAKTLTVLKERVLITNEKYAKAIGIPRSAATTCIKPEGTTSQLVAASSGLHDWHDSIYFRTVRSSKTDPLGQFMADMGVYVEDDVTDPSNTSIFYFPQEAPKGAVTRNDRTAKEFLDLWMVYQTAWCEHKPSATVSVKEEEWEEVKNWVWDNFDYVTGLAFLPHDGGSYKQAPYTDCTREEFEKLAKSSPSMLPWEELGLYELYDQTTGSQELACSASGGCDSVDLVAA